MEEFNQKQKQPQLKKKPVSKNIDQKEQMKDSPQEPTDQNQSGNMQPTKNQKKKMKKKDKLLKQQQQQAESSSSQEEDQELTNKEIKDIYSKLADPDLQDNNISKKDIEFLQGFSKVSKKGSSVIKRKEEALKASEMRNQFNHLSFEHQTLMEYENNRKGFQAPITATSKTEFINQKAKQKLNNQEHKFIKKKVAQWQDYEKNVKLGQLGFNKKELSKVNCQSVIDKCIEFNFDDEKYKAWICQVESWDQFVSQNIDKKNQIYSKLVKIRANYKSDSEEKDGFSSDNQDWSIKQSDGQKHSTRIKILNAVKRNQNFDEKYEETREDREARQSIAQAKREIHMKAMQEEQKLHEQTYSYSTNYNNYSQNKITLSESTSNSSYMTNASKMALYKQQEEQATLERHQRQQAYRDRMNNHGGQAKQTTYIDSDEEEYSDDSDGGGNAIEEGLKVVKNALNISSKKKSERLQRPAILDSIIDENIDTAERTKQLENLWFKQPEEAKPKHRHASSQKDSPSSDDLSSQMSVQKDFSQIYDNPERFKSSVIKQNTQNPLPTLQKQESQSLSEGQSQPPNYKTVLCKWYEKFRQCSKKDKCTFAHGQDELNFNRHKQFNTQQQQQSNQNTPETVAKKFPITNIVGQQPPVDQIFPQPIAQPTTLDISANADSNVQDEYDEEYYDQEEENYKYGFNYRFDKTKHPKFKTEMCRNIKDYGQCTFNGCTFAHTDVELRKIKQNQKVVKYPDLFQY